MEVLFPEYCVHCRRDLSPGWLIEKGRVRYWAKETPFLKYLCLDCLMRVRRQPLVCPVCGKERLDGSPHKRLCQKQSYLDRLIFVDFYANPVLKSAIKAFKFRSMRELAESLAEPLILRLQEEGWAQRLWERQAIVSFVPVSNWRRWARGFDQAEALAQVLAQNLGLSKKGLLIRKTLSVPQSRLQENTRAAVSQRQENIKGAFKPNLAPKPPKGLVVLVDDVYTSGATLQEAAGQLKRSGIQEVWGITMAKS